MPAFARYIHLLASAEPKKPVSQAPTKEEKLRLVQEWMDAGMSQRQFAEERGIDRGTFGNWCRGAYLGEHGKNNSHTSAKKSDALEMAKQHIRPIEISRRTGVHHGTVRNWLTDWRKKGLI